MSMNWREIALALSELPLQGSVIQKSHQIGFHGLLLELFHQQSGRWHLYIEVGTPASRIHALSTSVGSIKPHKTVKLQRFIQYLRSHVEQGRITAVEHINGDRVVLFTIERHGETVNMLIRLYSGAAANIMVLDQDHVIMDLMFRRPKRNELSGKPLAIELNEASGWVDDGRFPIRPLTAGISFNEQLEHEYMPVAEENPVDRLLVMVKAKRDHELAAVDSTISALEQRVKQTATYDSYRKTADLLNANRSAIPAKAEWVEVADYEDPNERTVTIALDPHCSPSENIERYWRLYHKTKGNHANAVEELEEAVARRAELVRRYGLLLEPEEGNFNLVALKQTVGEVQPQAQVRRDPYADAPGLRFTSGPFTLLVGRNATENDALLRRWAKGNDWWMHTRDVPGGYVFIKAIAGKSIPLDTLLDAATLALVYSKAKDAGKAELYYTQVKYLRRAKDAKQGTVLPTQEKNVSIVMDEKRLERLFSDRGK